MTKQTAFLVPVVLGFNQYEHDLYVTHRQLHYFSRKGRGALLTALTHWLGPSLFYRGDPRAHYQLGAAGLLETHINQGKIELSSGVHPQALVLIPRF